MSAPRSVAEVQANHVALEVEGIDGNTRMRASPLSIPVGLSVSGALMDPISKTFVAATEAFAPLQNTPVIRFR